MTPEKRIKQREEDIKRYLDRIAKYKSMIAEARRDIDDLKRAKRPDYK